MVLVNREIFIIIIVIIIVLRVVKVLLSEVANCSIHNMISHIIKRIRGQQIF